MSSVGFIDKLLAGVEVEWKPLSELGELVRGSGLQKKDFTDSGVPAIHYGQIYTHYGLSTTLTKSFVSPELAKQLRKVETGDVVITNTSENLKDVGKALVYLGHHQAVTGGHATIFKPGECILGKYFAYFSQTEAFASEKKKYAKGTKVIDVSATDLAKIRIPVPCPESPIKSLTIQGEIVRILDAFSGLTAEIKARLASELTSRRKQYNYYRNRLLSFEKGDVEWKRLGDIGEFTYGYAAKAQEAGNARFVRITDINNNGKLLPTDAKYVDVSADNERYILRKNDLLMARTGATYGKTVIFEEDYAAIYAGFLIRLRFDESLVSPKFYWHFAQSDFFWNQASKLVAGGGQPQFNANALREVKMPFPSVARQERIVAILDRFDALIDFIGEGLPRESALHQNQYEHYRGELFSFPLREGGAV